MYILNTVIDKSVHFEIMPITPSLYNLEDFYKVYEIDSSLKSEGIVVVDQTFLEEDYFSDYKQQLEGLLLGFMFSVK